MRHVGELSDVTTAQVRESRAEYRRAADALAPFKRILDVYTSQWFGNEGEKKGRRKKGTTTERPALDFLKAREAEPFLNARDDRGLKKALRELSPQDRRIAETALTVSTRRPYSIGSWNSRGLPRPDQGDESGHRTVGGCRVRRGHWQSTV
jgi:hypothetical protein